MLWPCSSERPWIGFGYGFTCPSAQRQPGFAEITDFLIQKADFLLSNSISLAVFCIFVNFCRTFRRFASTRGEKCIPCREFCGSYGLAMQKREICRPELQKSGFGGGAGEQEWRQNCVRVHQSRTL
ncbi:hypothetical protein KDL45_12305 [bacterium]|nr:hypothetical protein [bacterium]